MLVDGSFVDEELRGHLTDRLYAVRVGRQAFLYVLIEHKSQPEKRIAWQLAKYQIEVLKQWEREHPDWNLMPAVVPFTFYHGAAEWRVPDKFLALVDAEEGWKPYLLNFRFPVFDLGHFDDRDLSRQPRLKAWLMVAKYGTREFLLGEMKGQFIETLAAAPEDLPIFLRYMIESYRNFGERELREIIRGVRPEEETKMMSQFAQEIISKEKPRWVRDARQEGRQEGIATLFLLQAEEKYGQISDADRKKVLSADRITLEKWSLRLLKSDTLDGVFSEQRQSKQPINIIYCFDFPCLVALAGRFYLSIYISVLHIFSVYA